jgi:hypothetical protein
MEDENLLLDLKYGNSDGESVGVSVVEIPPNDTSNYFNQFAALSDSEFMKRIGESEEMNLNVFERKIIKVNDINSYFVYYRSGKMYSQMLFQYTHGKMLALACSYRYKEVDSLKTYYYHVVNSVVWNKE